jgi:O-methyltransferase
MVMFEATYAADGTAVANKSMNFMRNAQFDAAWKQVSEFNNPYWPGGTPDVRWRMHVCVWAARHALKVPGDFIECGVNTGMMMSMICQLTALPKTRRRALMFDTYSGIPVQSLPDDERDMAQRWNKNIYTFDSYEVAQRAFAPYPNVQLVKGVLPESLDTVDIKSVAYLSMDLNVASAEVASAEALWPKLSPGAVVVLDDFGFSDHLPQYAAWTRFANARGVSILEMPTGQGLILVPPARPNRPGSDAPAQT